MRKTKSQWKPLGKVIGRILSEAREDAGLNQEGLVRRMGWGASTNIVSGTETGARGLLFVEFVLIAKFLKRDPHELLDEFLMRGGKKLDEIAEGWEPTKSGE